MAILKANPFGEMSGKNSMSQKNSRNIFRSLASLYSVLTSEQKYSWLEFAKTAFKPFKKTNTGQYTGYLAFLSLINALNNSNNHKLNTSVYFLPGDSLMDVSSSLFPVSYVAPLYSVSNYIRSGESSSYPIKIDEVTIDTNNFLDCVLKWEGCVSPYLEETALIDPNNIVFGFNFYISDSFRNINGKPHNPFNTLIGSTGLLDFTLDPLTGSNGIRLNQYFASVRKHLSRFPALGRYFLFSLVSIGENGSLCVCDQKVIQLTAPT
jgi:hypothetical protein